MSSARRQPRAAVAVHSVLTGSPSQSISIGRRQRSACPRVDDTAPVPIDQRRERSAEDRGNSERHPFPETQILEKHVRVLYSTIRTVKSADHRTARRQWWSGFVHGGAVGVQRLIRGC